MTHRYWLSEWLDHNDFTELAQIERALLSPTVVADLQKRAGKAFRQAAIYTPEKQISIGFSLLAGRGIDLSGQLVCRSDVCRRRQVDELFGRVWHYFDRIVVNDNLAHDIDKHWHDSEWRMAETLVSNIQVLLYLRSMGAEDLVEFRPRPPACVHHWREHATHAGLTELAQNLDALIEEFAKDTKVILTSLDDGSTKFRLSHPLLEVAHAGVLTPESTAGISGPPERQALSIVMRRLISYLSSDISASHNYKASLGAVLKTHELFLHQLRPTSVADVVVNLRLPVLEGLSTSDLVEIRRDESDYFSRFRDALTKAIKERLKTSSSINATVLAEEIQSDLIEPRIRDITSRLFAAKNLLTKKSGVGFFLGAVSTTCGILSGLDPHLATMGGTGVTLACTATAASKYLDEARDISLDDMYFLWKASECGTHGVG